MDSTFTPPFAPVGERSVSVAYGASATRAEGDILALPFDAAPGEKLHRMNMALEVTSELVTTVTLTDEETGTIYRMSDAPGRSALLPKPAPQPAGTVSDGALKEALKTELGDKVQQALSYGEVTDDEWIGLAQLMQRSRPVLTVMPGKSGR